MSINQNIMKIFNRPIFILSTLLFVFSPPAAGKTRHTIETGDLQTEEYLPLLRGGKVAVFSNPTGLAGNRHIVDLLVDSSVQVGAILAPEHGFRGIADAGERVENSIDKATGIKVISLYGGTKVPLADIVRPYDYVVIDIQDVGLRYYTYYVTMIKLMNACAVAFADSRFWAQPFVLIDGTVHFQQSTFDCARLVYSNKEHCTRSLSLLVPTRYSARRLSYGGPTNYQPAA